MRFFYLLFILIAVGCSSTPSYNLDDEISWLPSVQKLRKGYVSKYYQGNFRGEGKSDAADIIYKSYQLIDDNTIKVVKYNAGLLPETSSTFSVEDGKFKLKTQYHFNAGDTISTLIANPVYMSWKGDLASSDVTIPYNEKATYQIKRQQLRTYNIEAESKKGLSFEFNISSQNIANSGATRGSLFTATYLDGIGLYAEETISGETTLKLELIEQFPLEKFLELQDNNIRRVAFIDPNTKIDSIADFSPCGKANRILDYYNTSPYASYKGGNYEFNNLILNNSDKQLLKNESGYLVYRFVINCEGKVGWFTTEEYDLNYQSKKFNTELKRQLLEILTEAGPWQPGIINEQSRDAYAYVSIKIDNGEIIEVLP